MLSIITPLHESGNGYIEETYNSLLAQTTNNFEWIILLNNGGEVPDYFKEDPRIKIHYSDKEGVIGSLKKEACSYAKYDIVVELDADDILTEDALVEIEKALSGVAVFAFSETIEFNEDYSTRLYDSYWGWEKAEAVIHGKTLEYNPAFQVNPASLRQIFWAPNHVRAWKAEAYNNIGGHNEELAIGDDHELVLKFYVNYGAAGFAHIKKPLYLYRLHDGNTYVERADTIAEQSWKNYNLYHTAVAMRWAKDTGLRCLDLGGRLNKAEGFESVDLFDADVVADLSQTWKFKDNSVGVLRASDFIEHLKDPIHLMNEAYRVLAPGGWFLISVPSTDGKGAFQDPTHVSFWNENSFWYYTNKEYAKYIPQFAGKFQVSRLVTTIPSEWHKEHNIPYVITELICGKPGYKPVGEWLW